MKKRERKRMDETLPKDQRKQTSHVHFYVSFLYNFFPSLFLASKRYYYQLKKKKMNHNVIYILFTEDQNSKVFFFSDSLAMVGNDEWCDEGFLLQNKSEINS